MKTMGVGELKTHFSDVLDSVEQGQSIVISRGRKKAKVAVIVPYEQFGKSAKQRSLGVLEDRATYTIRKDFKMSDEELLSS